MREITDDELMNKVEELEGELETALAQVDDLVLDLEEANSIAATLTERLHEAAEVMARTHRIDNTPHAKREWIERGTLRVKALIM